MNSTILQFVKKGTTTKAALHYNQRVKMLHSPSLHPQDGEWTLVLHEAVSVKELL